MKTHLSLSLALTLISSAALAEDKPAAAAPATDTILWPAEALKWTDAPGAKGVQITTFWGDMMKDGHAGGMAKFAAGTKHPLHTHTNDVRGIIISGTFLVALEGQPDTKLGPGSYFMIPGGKKHTSGCDTGAPCVVFQDTLLKFDFNPIGAPPPPAPAKK